MTLEFASGKSIEITGAKRGKSHSGGILRERLLISFWLAGSLDEAYNLFTESECAKMTVTTEDGAQIYTDYVIRESFRVAPEIDKDGTQKEEVTVSMAQISYLEKQLSRLGV